MAMGGSPSLRGLTVIELGQSVAGPYAGFLLRQLGARVIKVERSEGDDTRAWGPPWWGPESVMFAAVNAGKESLVLDLRQPGDREVLLRLAGRADVLIQNWRAGSLKRLGLGGDALRERCPRLIYASISAYGSGGPLAGQPGYDPLVQAFSGVMSITGHPGQPPVRVTVSVLDMGSAMWTVIGVLMALRERERTGLGCEIEGSLFETGLAWMPYQLAGVMAGGGQPGKHGTGLDFLVPYQAFAAADGELMIAAGNDRLWQALCSAIERPDLGEDADLATNPLRVAHRERVQSELGRTFKWRPVADWIERLRAAGVPCSPIQDLPQVLAHEQTEAVRMIAEIDHPDVPGFRLLGLPLRFDGVRPPAGSRPPRLGEHTEAIKAELDRG